MNPESELDGDQLHSRAISTTADGTRIRDAHSCDQPSGWGDVLGKLALGRGGTDPTCADRIGGHVVLACAEFLDCWYEDR